MTPAEERLAAMDAALERIRQIGNPNSPESPAVPYGALPFDLTDAWEGALAHLRDGLVRLVDFASAESSLGRGTAGRSIIGWKGDLATVWAGAVTADEREAHFASLDADFRCRASAIRIVIASLEVAASLCAAAGSPTMAPAAFRSLLKLVAELQSF